MAQKYWIGGQLIYWYFPIIYYCPCYDAPVIIVFSFFSSSPQLQTVTRTEGFDDSLIAANASAEEATEGNESSTISGVDIVLNHKLQETGFDKKQYMTYIKDYVKAWVAWCASEKEFWFWMIFGSVKWTCLFACLVLKPSCKRPNQIEWRALWLTSNQKSRKSWGTSRTTR